MLNDFSKLDAQTMEGALATMSFEEASQWFDFSALPESTVSCPIPPVTRYESFINSNWSVVTSITLLTIGFGILFSMI